jgi:transglutaminase-like putative cysteine protease
LLRTLAVSLVPAGVLAATWLRFESPVNQPLRSVAVAGLALLPAFVRPLWARVAVFVVSAGMGVWLAYGLSPFHPRHLFPELGRRFANGFLDFYDIRLPFDPRVHAEMRGVLLTAVFGFSLAVALLVAARRAVPATIVFLFGAGWPATLRGTGGLGVGILVLLGALVLLAGLTARNVPRVAFPAIAGLAVAALVASSSSAVAKTGVVDWQGWDFYTQPDRPVSVSFVWDGNYSGLSWPRKRTTVLEVKAPPRSLFWRAAVLDRFDGTRWVETDPLRGDALEPKTGPLVHQDVRVLALSDTRLVGASVPIRYDAGDAPLVSHVDGIAQLPSGLTRGFRYEAWSRAPRPTASELAASKPIYPVELVEPRTFLDVGADGTMPAFGRPRTTVDPIGRTALAVAGDARTPYAAASALESWFRSTGGFRYTNRPPARTLGEFVTRTRAGYCQHFAGAMALMLRYLGVPARVAVGFSSGVYDAKKGIWRVTDHDAHAWVEAWFRGYGWLPFDPTPAGRPERGQLSAPYARAVRVGGGSSAGGPQAAGGGAGEERAQTDHRHGETPGTGVKQFGPGTARGSRRPAGGSLLLLVLLLVGAVAAAVVATKLVRRRIRYLTRDPRRVAAACRHELADYLVDQQLDAARSATLHELGALVRHELSVEPDAFVAAATAARFGPPEGAARAARDARRELRALLRRMRVRLRARDRVRGLVSLRSFGFAP